MATLAAADLSQVAVTLGLSSERVETVVELLDSGNTVPFITRYRKDQTGALDEEQIRAIQSRVMKLRLLAERKQTILRSIESQGKLTPELSAAIAAADTTKRLEDLYLPFKPKKQTLATIARSRGLEQLALEILNADPIANDLDARAADFISVDKNVRSAPDALLGAGHVLAEIFSERADFRGKIRALFERSGRLVSTRVEPEAPAETNAASEEKDAAPPLGGQQLLPFEDETPPAPAAAESSPPEAADGSTTLKAGAETEAEGGYKPLPGQISFLESEEPNALAPAAVNRSAERKRRKEKQKKKQEAQREAREQQAFRDYFKFSEALSRLPPHRVLALNRGERARVLRIRIEVDLEAMFAVVDEMLAPDGHPHADFLRGCGRDALTRLVLPGLEREVRRELSDRAELHAVEVFARNLRNLLLQPPIRDRRVLAVDPAFRSGCKLAALDEFGNLLEHGIIHLVGREERRDAAKETLIRLVREHNLNVIVIGNGTGCRAAEQWISDIIASDFADTGLAYAIVNEAGASVYSTSRLGREEFPQYDATLRGAISIGRRLQDPLSELVKIDPASIGVGMYQHDVKAKHLRESLDAVVESCVNFVGVDINTASPALLRYVSGLNQLTAQRVYDHRRTYGPFKAREELKAISGFGEATFIQAAGFLKIVGGDNPLDTTWIHPESYPIAEKVLEKLEARTADLADGATIAPLAERAAQADATALSQELNVGVLTLQDILAQLARPGRDPREGLPQPIFKHGVLKLDDLTPGMDLVGTVLNVVDFGAFVDIGLKDSGLVHISQLANKFVESPHQVVAVGDTVKVWVMGIDKERRRVSLTMIDPASKPQPQERRPPEQRQGQGGERRERPPRPQRPPQGQRAPQGQGIPQGQQQGRPPQRGGRGQQRSGQGRLQQQRSAIPQRKAKPKPVVPITQGMKEGKEPMRTFGDLKQFFEATPDPTPEPPAS